MAIFDYLRISLARPGLPLLLERAGVVENPRDRHEWLGAAFSDRRDFLYRKKKFSYVPVEGEVGFLTGFFGRDNTGLGHAGPDENFQLRKLENWDLAFFALDLRPDRQIALVQYNGRVGSTRGLLEAYLEAIARKDTFRDWAPHVEYLSNEASFWEVAKKYRGKITRLRFNFVPPNALRAEERVMDFIRDASEHANAQQVTHQYEDPDGGLETDGDLIRGSVNVAAAGGGSAEIKVGKKTVFSDNQYKATESVPHAEVPDPEKPLTISGFLKNFFKL